MKELETLEKKGDYLGLIENVRQQVVHNKRIFTEPYIKQWCGRRWRNLFLQEAANDPKVVKRASKRKLIGKDKRPDKQKIAERFLRGENLEEWRLEMPEAQFGEISNTTLVFCPGLLNGLLPVRAFTAMFPAIVESHGWKVIRSDSHPVRSCDANTADILETVQKGMGLDADTHVIAEEEAVPPGDIFLMGYSKGASDILAFLAKYPELKDRIRCIILWAGANKGSFTADHIYDTIKDLGVDTIRKKISEFLKMISPIVSIEGPLRRFDEYDIKGALLDLTTHTRKNFLETHADAIDALDIPIFSFSGSTSVLEVPHFQMADTQRLNKYDANNDMQLTQDQAKVDFPMATHLSMLHGHHWDLSYDPFPVSMRMGSPYLDHPFPKEAALTAHFKFAAELGLID